MPAHIQHNQAIGLNCIWIAIGIVLLLMHISGKDYKGEVTCLIY